jgi:pyrroloquinoline-quinone synthase
MAQAARHSSAFEAELRRTAEEFYHDKHPFHALLHGGALNKGQVQAWALNRYCFQVSVPQKDALLIARSSDPGFRREWTLRLLDHDGYGEDEGGIARWLKLTDGLGLDRDYVRSMSGALPATRFAIDAYLRFAREQQFTAVMATTLTELFSAKLHRERMARMLSCYDFVDRETLTYFRQRLTHAPRDASFALEYVLSHANSHEEQQACLEAVRFKCAVLWTLLDVLHFAYVEGNPPPGAFVPAS